MTKAYSFELFPPKTEKGMTNLQATVTELQTRNPAFFSCTYGAGGSTQNNTFATVDWLREQSIDTAPHLTCIGNSVTETLEILQRYVDQGINRVVALRGDRPSGTGLIDSELTHANDLVALIREHFNDHFHIEVAAYPEMHPQAAGPQADLRYFAQKVQAGANSAITQYFYNADAYFDFVDRAQMLGVSVPIVPGIMPITNYSQLMRFSEMCGAEIPRWIRLRLAEFGDDRESIRAFGTDVVTEMCQTLLENQVPGLHFYTLNNAAATMAIWKGLSG